MDVQVSDLVHLIGEKEIEIIILRKTVEDLHQALQDAESKKSEDTGE